MNNYCYMHIERVKSIRKMDAMYEHNYRTVMVLNADKTLSYENDELVSLNGKTYKETFVEKAERMGYTDSTGSGKPLTRDNRTYALDIQMTFSREQLPNINLSEWKEKNVEWLKEQFDIPGMESNVLSVMYHGDEEGNVHCHAFVTPFDKNGKFAATKMMGTPSKLKELQDTYAEKMQSFDLERGLRGSIATHSTIKKFYAALNKEAEKELPTPKPQETALDYKKRCDKIYQNLLMKHLKATLDLKRAKVEIGTKNKQYKNKERKAFLEERNSFYKEKDEIERTLEMPIDEASKKLKEYENILEAIETEPDDLRDRHLDLIQRWLEETRDRKKAPKLEEDLMIDNPYIERTDDSE